MSILMASPNKHENASYEVVLIESWDEYLSMISDSPYQNWAFRGQRDASAPLFSALSRYLISFRVDPRAWPEQEERILRIFKRKAIHFLDVVPDREDDFEWLALMQDHGAPTRLLDFTWSPYVAAFFALHNSTTEAVIWACNPIEIEKTKRLDMTKVGSFRKYFLSTSDNFVWLGEPYAMNRRLIAQSGTFLVPAVLDKSIEQILMDYPNPKDTLIKFILPAEKVREEGMRELYRMNITQATLFPDLDGLARSLAYELEFHWAYDPRTMKSRHR
jgi:FRG domain-containing protein